MSRETSESRIDTDSICHIYALRKVRDDMLYHVGKYL